MPMECLSAFPRENCKRNLDVHFSDIDFHFAPFFGYSARAASRDSSRSRAARLNELHSLRTLMRSRKDWIVRVRQMVSPKTVIFQSPCKTAQHAPGLYRTALRLLLFRTRSLR